MQIDDITVLLTLLLIFTKVEQLKAETESYVQERSQS